MADNIGPPYLCNPLFQLGLLLSTSQNSMTRIKAVVSAKIYYTHLKLYLKVECFTVMSLEKLYIYLFYGGGGHDHYYLGLKVKVDISELYKIMMKMILVSIINHLCLFTLQVCWTQDSFNGEFWDLCNLVLFINKGWRRPLCLIDFVYCCYMLMIDIAHHVSKLSNLYRTNTTCKFILYLS